ncbi:MAG: hypothetical protein DWQ01_01400 [Planctomycetota bacterium]|nr:MAG: hypothetical protein DWQ01_01400 [Planctomycetota bacterium]
MQLATLSLLLFGICAAPQTGQQDALSTLAPLGEKPAATLITEDHDPRLVQVKFVHDSGVRLRQGRFVGTGDDLEAINGTLDGLGVTRKRLFQQSESWLENWRLQGEARSGIALHDLNLFFLVELPEDGLVGSVCDWLNTFDMVELSWPVGRVEDPNVIPVHLQSNFSTLLPSPDFQNLQGYREAAPLGVDGDWGNLFSGGRGIGTVIADVETGWTDDHEDIAHKALGNYVGLPMTYYPWDHGTAVFGELIGEDNGEGVLGLVYEADVLMSTHQGNSNNIPTAIAHAANAVGVGDAVVLEVQCYHGPPSPHPCEYDAGIFATVQTATANGTHVFAAAGNGDNDLDSGAYGGAFDRSVRDSGAVMVGASNGSSLDKAGFSNYGSRCDAHGWGYDVTTAGYGYLYSGGTVQTEYTDSFSGTSSATPIVTGAGLILNAVHREAFGSPMDPFVLRDLLTNTGTPQGAGGNIGPRPDVRLALERLQVPKVIIAGNLVPGGSGTATIYGPSGDTFHMMYSKTLAATPAYMPPYGYLYLSTPLDRHEIDVLPASGQFTYNFNIPNNGGLSGTTIGYVQGAVLFNTLPGTGTFTNYYPIEVQ